MESMKKRRSVAVKEVLDLLSKELEERRSMLTMHDAYAKVLEELDELWDEIKLPANKRSLKAIRSEASQVAVRAIRLMIDLT
jgi:hypothetical protein